MRTLLCLSIIFTLFAVSCASDDQRAIKEVMSIRAKAFETKDADLYMTLIAPDYKQEKKGKTVGPGEVKKNFEVNVKLFDTIRLTSTDRTIYTEGDRAEVFQKTIIDATDDQGKSRLRIKEKLSLARENGKWLIVRESDEDFFYGYVFGRSKD
jgi:ketosteroid isomerase-like protein